MTPSQFSKSIASALQAVGFVKEQNVLRLSGVDLTVLMTVQKGFGNQMHINVGFWAHALGREIPSRVEQSHCYFRLERLVPEFHEDIVTAGALIEPLQPAALARLVDEIANVIGSKLSHLATLPGLREKIASGESAGLVTKELRDFLTS